MLTVLKTGNSLILLILLLVGQISTESNCAKAYYLKFLNLNIDKLVRSPIFRISVIPAKAGHAAKL